MTDEYGNGRLSALREIKKFCQNKKDKVQTEFNSEPNEFKKIAMKAVISGMNDVIQKCNNKIFNTSEYSKEQS